MERRFNCNRNSPDNGLEKTNNRKHFGRYYQTLKDSGTGSAVSIKTPGAPCLQSYLKIHLFFNLFSIILL